MDSIQDNHSLIDEQRELEVLLVKYQQAQTNFLRTVGKTPRNLWPQTRPIATARRLLVVAHKNLLLKQRLLSVVVQNGA